MVVFQITSQISGFGKDVTTVTEYFEADSTLEAADAAKEMYGDHFLQIVSMEEMGEECNCDCGKDSCNCG